MKAVAASAVALLCLMALAGCGQMGPLYLPAGASPPADVHVAPAPATTHAPAAASVAPPAVSQPPVKP
ncbi:MAG TPA: lipoprotein [Gammaproteobacteria bacterium]|nr:lipoprotein [Gammaproteobacteria bacterium]